MDHSYWREPHPKCPHCKQVQQDYQDAAMWEDGEVWPITCQDCRKEFWVLTSTTVQFSSAVSEEAASEEEFGPQEASESDDGSEDLPGMPL